MPAPDTAVSTKLVEVLLSARKPADVEQLLKLAQKAGYGDARAIGDKENNAGPIEIASSPYNALPERLTNAIDGVIEMLARLAGYHTFDDWPNLPQGPREAARILLNLPKAGMADLTDKERRKLAELVSVMLDDSGIKQRPTVTVSDQGIGQHPMEMPGGMLSLNSSNKLHKPWQHGAYGQGGSATLRFAPYTIFISRKRPELLDDGQEDLVGWTVAFKDEGDPYKDALPVYRYLVGADNQVSTFDPALLPDPDWYGTRIVHVAYELTKYSAAYTQLSNGAWGMFQAALFDPVLPFLLGGRRQTDLDAVKKGTVADDDMSDLAVTKTDSTRVVLGNKMRLDVGPPGNDPEIAWRGSETVDLTKAHGRDLGKLRVNYWVVRRPLDSERTTDPTLGYVNAESAMTVTLGGQRHETERRAWIKEKLGLPYLAKNLIVQVDIDELSPPARRQLFSSSRERMVDGPMKDLVYAEALEILKRDDELRRLEREQRERAMSKGAEDVAQGVRDKLRKWVDTFLKGQTRTITVDDDTTETVGPPDNKKGGTSKPRSTDDTNLPNAPTDMKFERDPITIRQGKRTTIWVHVDAKNGYLTRHEDDLTVRFSDDLDAKVQHVGMSELLAGKSLWTLQAGADAPVGDGEIEALLLTPNGLITATAKIIVVPAPKENKHKKKKEVPEKGPNIVWVTRDEWDADFNEKTVGQVMIGTDATDIRINRHHPLLEKAIDQNKSLGEEAGKTRANKYLFAMACGLFRQEWMMRESERPADALVRGEQERMAEAVLIAIDDKSLDQEED